MGLNTVIISTDEYLELKTLQTARLQGGLPCFHTYINEPNRGAQYGFKVFYVATYNEAIKELIAENHRVNETNKKLQSQLTENMNVFRSLESTPDVASIKKRWWQKIF